MQSARAVRPCEVLVVSGVPLGDAGGGQRPAQLARMLDRRFCRVKYAYIYPSASFEKGTSFVSGAGGLKIEQVQLSRGVVGSLVASLSDGARVIVEVPHPSVLPVMRAARRRGLQVVLEILDDWFDPALGGDWFEADALRKMMGVADRVVATARMLQRRASEHFEGRVEYLPNAASELQFRPPRQVPAAAPEWPPDLPRTGGRVALYFGSLYGSWLLWDYIHAAARLCPGTTFAVIGDPTPAVRELNRGFANVVLLGLKQHHELPAYVRAASVGLLPFAPGPLLETISPVKVFEYGFAGLPVVATYSDELRGLPFIHQAADAAHFASLACAPLQAPTPATLSPFLRDSSWGAVVDDLLERPPVSAAFAVVVLCHNDADVIGGFVRSLLAHVPPGSRVRVVVVDTASSDGSPLVLAALRRELGEVVTVVRLESTSRSSGWDAGIRAADVEGAPSNATLVAMFEPEDVVTSSSWMHEAEAAHAANAELGAIGPDAGWFDFRGQPRDEDARHAPHRAPEAETMKLGFQETVGFLRPQALVAKLDALRAVPAFDHRFSATGHEVIDACVALREAGYFLAYRQMAGVVRLPRQQEAAGFGLSRGSTVDEAVARRSAASLAAKWAHRPELLVKQSRKRDDRGR